MGQNLVSGPVLVWILSLGGSVGVGAATRAWCCSPRRQRGRPCRGGAPRSEPHAQLKLSGWPEWRSRSGPRSRPGPGVCSGTSWSTGRTSSTRCAARTWASTCTARCAAQVGPPGPPGSTGSQALWGGDSDRGGPSESSWTSSYLSLAPPPELSGYY